MNDYYNNSYNNYYGGYQPQYQPPRLPAPYNPSPPEPPEVTLKRQQGRNLWKRSTGLGFFILGYFVTMQLLVIFAKDIISTAGTEITSGSNLDYYLQIFASVGAVLIPGAIFLAASRYRLRDGYKRTFVKPTLLIPLVLMGMGAAMLANLAATMLDSNLSIFGLENSLSIMDDEPLTFSGVWLSVIATAIVPSFAEEFAFRGIALGALRRYGDAFAIVASSVMFAAMHANSTQIAFVFPLALVFGLIDVVADSIVPSVILHFLNNFYAVALNGLETNNNLDEKTVMAIQLGIIVLFLIAGIVSFIYLAKRRPEIFKVNDRDSTPSDSPVSMLGFKEKIRQFFVNPGIMISLGVFASLVIYFLIPWQS